MGELVIVRDYAGKPVVCRLCEVTDSKIYVASESEYSNIIKGIESFGPVGFPPEDVFRYDPAFAGAGGVEWSKLQPYGS